MRSGFWGRSIHPGKLATLKFAGEEPASWEACWKAWQFHRNDTAFHNVMKPELRWLPAVMQCKCLEIMKISGMQKIHKIFKHAQWSGGNLERIDETETLVGATCRGLSMMSAHLVPKDRWQKVAYPCLPQLFFHNFTDFTAFLDFFISKL